MDNNADNFEVVINRRGTGSRKWDDVAAVFGNDKVLPLWIADMDFAAPSNAVEKIIERAKHPIYAYNNNDLEFVEAIVNWTKNRHNWDIKNEWIVQTPGVVPAIVMSILALSKENEGVIIQTPVYPPFFAAIEDNKRVVVKNELVFNKGRYEINFVDLEEKFADKNNRIFLLCSPHNPVGRVWTKSELEKIHKLAIKYNIQVLSDEIHSDIVYEGHKHTVFASLAKAENSEVVTFMAASKTFNIAGLNTSYVIIPCGYKRELIRGQINRLHINRNNIFGVLATKEVYKSGEEWLKNLLLYLEKNADTLVEFIETRLPKIKVVKPEGTFLAWLDFSAYFDRSDELNKFLIEKAHLGLNPGIAFGEQGECFARLNFATSRNILLEALLQLEAALKIID